MKKRMYPNKLKIGKRTFQLAVVSKIAAQPGDKKGTYRRGETDSANNAISILSRLSEKEMFETLVHEALHAFEKTYKLKLSHKLIYALEGPLAAFIKDNFHLVPKR